MTPIQESLQEKILKAEEATRIILKYEKTKQEDFVKDLRDVYAVTHAMVLVIEAILDIGAHILVNRFNKKINFYTDVPEFLGELKIFSPTLTKEVLAMVKFRNKAVHMYETINSKNIYQYSRKAPKQFERIFKILLPFLNQ